NVVPFRPPVQAESAPALTPVERNAFSELANRLTARLRSSKDKPDEAEQIAPQTATEPLAEAVPDPTAAPQAGRVPAAAISADQLPILDRLPIGVLVYRLDKLIYANRAFLDWTGYPDLRALEDAGGLDALF